MASWQGLSIDLKKRIIGKLDFLARMRLSCCSKVSKSLVDSTDFFIPRVNFIEENGKFTLMFFTEINRSVKLEIEGKAGRKQAVIMKRTIRHKSVREKSLIIPSTSPLQLATLIFKSLISPSKTTLGGLEISTCDLKLEDILEIDGILGDSSIRAHLLTLRNDTRDAVFLARCQDIKEVQIVSQRAFYSFWPCEGIRGKMKKASCGEYVNGRIGVYVWRNYQKGGDKKVIKELERYARHQVTVPSVFSTPDDTVAVRKICRTSAGFSRISMTSKCGSVEETTWQGDECEMDCTEMKRSSCLLHWACRIHTDPFVHWYYTKGIHQVPGNENVWKMREILVPMPKKINQYSEFRNEWNEIYSDITGKTPLFHWIMAFPVLLVAIFWGILYVYKSEINEFFGS